MSKLHSIDNAPCIGSLRDHIETLADVAYHAIDASTFGQVPQFNRVRMQHSSTVTDGQADWQIRQDQKNLHESNKCSVAWIDRPATGRGVALSKMRVKFFQEKFRGILAIAF